MARDVGSGAVGGEEGQVCCARSRSDRPTSAGSRPGCGYHPAGALGDMHEKGEGRTSLVFVAFDERSSPSHRARPAVRGAGFGEVLAGARACPSAIGLVVLDTDVVKSAPLITLPVVPVGDDRAGDVRRGACARRSAYPGPGTPAIIGILRAATRRCSSRAGVAAGAAGVPDPRHRLLGSTTPQPCCPAWTLQGVLAVASRLEQRPHARHRPWEHGTAAAHHEVMAPPSSCGPGARVRAAGRCAGSRRTAAGSAGPPRVLSRADVQRRDPQAPGAEDHIPRYRRCPTNEEVTHAPASARPSPAAVRARPDHRPRCARAL